VLPPRPSVNSAAEKALDGNLKALEAKLDADCMALIGPIQVGVENKVRSALEAITDRRKRLAIILHTGGGLVEITERMVNIIRHHYSEVVFIIPNVAMSAGTIFVMSGDEIMMDYSSCLGPIDPQVEREGKLVPALSYLIQYDRLIQKAAVGTLTSAEFAILSKQDLAELHQFEMARDLSISLLKTWMATYKFKDWVWSKSRNRAITEEDREERAESIATKLMDNELWGSHGRGIPMKVLQGEMKLKIDDFGADPELSKLIREYFDLLVDYVVKNEIPHLAHTRGFL
jgi:Serine dehydrogenase proteinase